MNRITGWQLQLKMFYALPLMYSKRMFKECSNKEECLDYIVENNSESWSLLDYKESDNTKQLRKDRQNEQTILK